MAMWDLAGKRAGMPVLAENVTALAEVRREISIPVVTGEELHTKFEFREVFEQRAADITNPDVCNVGGILELKEIAAMAETYFVAVSPHNYNSTTLGLAATLQVSATMPNFLITEYFANLEEFGRDVAVEPFEVIDGYIDSRARLASASSSTRQRWQDSRTSSSRLERSLAPRGRRRSSTR